ncbi:MULTISPECIES: hypothetical protein [Bacillus cereus group]|uniref:hypothetical protein n=1 Tax=Bacillus cereus group TaxID=86661 RepID=UPI002E23F559|nr:MULTISPECIES: hypothetical protein [Bacillus cereus group]MED1431132.1 hypothetical protein [Bacillus mycoides]MED1436941.1 hypothetical protein [Bacillus mycoides]MED1473209.1 hypothetical protein [Bacillus pseudomycoides]
MGENKTGFHDLSNYTTEYVKKEDYLKVVEEKEFFENKLKQEVNCSLDKNREIEKLRKEIKSLIVLKKELDRECEGWKENCLRITNNNMIRVNRIKNLEESLTLTCEGYDKLKEENEYLFQKLGEQFNVGGINMGKEPREQNKMKKFDVNLFDDKGISLVRAVIESDSKQTIYDSICFTEEDEFIVFDDILAGIGKGVRKSNIRRFRIEELNEEK